MAIAKLNCTSGIQCRQYTLSSVCIGDVSCFRCISGGKGGVPVPKILISFSDFKYGKREIEKEKAQCKRNHHQFINKCKNDNDGEINK